MITLDEFFSEKKQTSDLLIFDGNNLAARANFVSQDLHRSDGTKTGVVYISLKSIKSLIERFQPKKVIVVFDRGWSKRRIEIYPQYKEDRKSENKTEEELKNRNEYLNQIKRLQEYINYLSINQVIISKTEADDIIAYLLNKTITNNMQKETILVSTDTDFFQFIPFGVQIFNPIKNQFIDNIYIKEKLNINSDEYLIYKSMLGDDSDNISGISSFGKVAAIKILNEKKCNNLNDVKEIAKTIKGKKYENLIKSFDVVERNYKLIDLTTNYLDIETIQEIEKQTNEFKTLNVEKLLELSKQDEISWDEFFFKELI